MSNLWCHLPERWVHCFVLLSYLSIATANSECAKVLACDFLAVSGDFAIAGAVPPPQGGTSVAALAASMQPGSWALLNTNNFDRGAVLVPPPGGSVLEYMDSAVWNPVNKSVMILGGSHSPSGSPNCPNSADLFLKYSDAANSWANNLPDPCPNFDNAFNAGIGHGYEHNTINPSTGDFYHRQYYSGKVMAFRAATQAWSQLAPVPSGVFQVAGALQFFPERNDLVFVDGDWGVWSYSLSSSHWTQVGVTNGGGPPSLPKLPMGSYHNFAEYSAAKHVLVFGGGNGSSDVYQMNSSGAIKKMKNAPMGLGITRTIITADPVGGNLLAWDATGKAWEYDPTTDVWASTEIASPILPNSRFGGVDNTVAASISTYGVVMFVQYNNANSSVYLYKHLTGVPGRGQTGTTVTSSGARIGAADTVRNMATSNSVTVTVSNNSTPAGSADFQTRCNSVGVVRCVGFDSLSDITGTYGDNSGIRPGDATPALDSTIKASGNSSLKLTVPSNSGANSSGSYFTNFSNDLSVQFGENSEFYIQWRQRFSPEFLNTNYQGGEGWKQAIIGTGDQAGRRHSSCTALEVVIQNTYQRGFPQMYNSCSGSTSHGPYAPFEEPFGSSDFKMQSARPAPYCLYSQGQTNPPRYFPPVGNCFGYFPNEWMTFQVRIKMGPRVNDEFTNSYVQLWVGREGQPSQQVIDWGPYNLSAGSVSENQRYGKVWLLNYNTGKSSSQTHATAYVWYDELIISRHRVPDPK